MLAIAHALANRELARCGGEIAHWHCRCRHGHDAAQRGAGDDTDREGFHGTLPIGSARPVTSPPTLSWRLWYHGRRSAGDHEALKNEEGGDCGSTSPRSLDELAQLRTYTAHYSPC